MYRTISFSFLFLLALTAVPLAGLAQHHGGGGGGMMGGGRPGGMAPGGAAIHGGHPAGIGGAGLHGGNTHPHGNFAPGHHGGTSGGNVATTANAASINASGQHSSAVTQAQSFYHRNDSAFGSGTGTANNGNQSTNWAVMTRSDGVNHVMAASASQRQLAQAQQQFHASNFADHHSSFQNSLSSNERRGISDNVLLRNSPSFREFHRNGDTPPDQFHPALTTIRTSNSRFPTGAALGTYNFQLGTFSNLVNPNYNFQSQTFANVSNRGYNFQLGTFNNPTPGTGFSNLPGTAGNPGAGSFEPGSNQGSSALSTAPGTGGNPGAGTFLPGSNTISSALSTAPGTGGNPGAGSFEPGSSAGSSALSTAPGTGGNPGAGTFLPGSNTISSALSTAPGTGGNPGAGSFQPGDPTPSTVAGSTVPVGAGFRFNSGFGAAAAGGYGGGYIPSPAPIDTSDIDDLDDL